MQRKIARTEPEIFTARFAATTRKSAESIAQLMDALRYGPVATFVVCISENPERWEAGGYFQERPDAVTLDLLAAATGNGPFALAEITETDWVAKYRNDHCPIRFGRFWIHGSHESGECPEGCVPLKIDASLAFGTGHHGTTQGCLAFMERLQACGLMAHKVCDIGCGTGILAIAAAKLWPCRVVVSDNDPDATALARNNLAANRVAERVDVVDCTGFAGGAFERLTPFDVIVANILSGPLKQLAGEFARHTRPGGHLIMSGLLVEEYAEMADAIETRGFLAAFRLQLGEWLTIHFIRTG